MILLLLLIVIALVCLAFFCGSEMAYLSSNKLKLRHLADEGDQNARRVWRFHQNPNRFLTMILLGTNLMHVTVVGLSTYLLEARFAITQEWLVTLIVAPVIIVFAETIPKDWFRRQADVYIYRFAPALNFLDRVLSGLSKGLMVLSDFLIALSRPRLKRSPFVTREEFRYVIEESTKGGVLLEHEKQLINTILNLSSVRAEEVMVPVARFPKVSLTSKVHDVKALARAGKADAILVYEEIPSIIVGMIYVFDLLFEEDESQALSRFLKAPFFIAQDLSAEKALFLLQLKRTSYALVINPRREVVGVTSIERLIQI